MLHLLVLDKGTFTAEGPIARFATQEFLLCSFSNISLSCCDFGLGSISILLVR
jgi:hypothetical protein